MCARIRPQLSLGRDAEGQRTLVGSLLVKAIPFGILGFLKNTLIPALRSVNFPVWEGMAWGAGRRPTLRRPAADFFCGKLWKSGAPFFSGSFLLQAA